jgi:hypothetical protein
MGEIYSGSWLAAADLFVHNDRLLAQNLSYANGEMSTFLMIDWRKREKFSNIPVNKPIEKNEILGGGIPVHTSDVMDFAAMHLSSFERYSSHIKGSNKDDQLVQQVLSLLSPAINKLKETLIFGVDRSDFKRRIGAQTLVLIPYFAQVQWRTAESKLSNRPLYLNATYYSLKSHFSRFIIAVQNDKDYNFVANSGLQVDNILRVEVGDGGHTKLPVAMLQHVIRGLRQGDEAYSNVKYVFYVEADMMFTLRFMSKVFNVFQYEKDLVVFPHRLMPYLPGYLESVKKQPIGLELDPYFSGSTVERDKIIKKSPTKRIPSSYSCCSDLLNCTTRSHWVSLKNPSSKINRLYGIPVVISTSHDPFEGGKFRPCNVTIGQRRCPGLYFSSERTATNYR